jgi:hypothetical protein
MQYRSFCSRTSLEAYWGSSKWLKHVCAEGRRSLSSPFLDTTKFMCPRPSMGERSLDRRGEGRGRAATHLPDTNLRNFLFSASSKECRISQKKAMVSSLPS